MSALEPDPISVPGQVYALLSCVGPSANQKCDHVAVKIRGCFATKDEASAWAKRLQKLDPDFDIYMVNMGNWLYVPPPQTIDDAHYQDEKLEEIIQGFREAQDDAKAHFEERKNTMKLQSVKELEEAGQSESSSSMNESSLSASSSSSESQEPSSDSDSKPLGSSES